MGSWSMNSPSSRVQHQDLRAGLDLPTFRGRRPVDDRVGPRCGDGREQDGNGRKPVASESDGEAHRDRPAMVSAKGETAGGRTSSALVRELLADHNSGSGPRRNGTAFADSPQSKPVRARLWGASPELARCGILLASSSPAIDPSRSQGPEVAPPAAARWFRNPSYPDRTHQAGRIRLAASLKACDDKLAEIRKKLGLLADHARRVNHEPLAHQLQGARDRIAEAASRMPREAGELYHEDAERLEFAEQAFARLLGRWDSVAS